MHHPAYWLSFFRLGSPFTAFGQPLKGLKAPDEAGSVAHNARVIDSEGNWFVLARERRFVEAQERISGLAFHETGLLNYAPIGLKP
jgi:hypothetical protein